jgi:hypothetical protein
MRQSQELLQPVALRVAKRLDRNKGIGTTNDRTDRENQDIIQPMQLAMLTARIVQGCKVFKHRYSVPEWCDCPVALAAQLVIIWKQVRLIRN